MGPGQAIACPSVFWRRQSVTVPGVQRGPDPDDWFGDQDPEERRLPDAPPDETVALADDWLDDEPDGREPRRPWTQTIDKRIVTVAVSLIALLIAGLAAAGVFSSGGSPAAISTPSQTATGHTTTAPTTTATQPLPAPSTTLTPGDKGTQVAVLQRALARLGFRAERPTACTVPATTSAVKRFQQSAGLRVGRDPRPGDAARARDRPEQRVGLRRVRRGPDRDRDAVRPDGRSTSTRSAHSRLHLVEHGSDGLVVTGTTGRPDALGTRAAPALPRPPSSVGKRATVVAATGTNDTHHSAPLTHQANKLGSTVPRRGAVLQRPPQRGIVSHFRRSPRHRQAGRRLQHSQPHVVNIEPRPSPAGRVENVARGEAGARRPREARGSSVRPRPLRGRRQPPPFLELGGGRHLGPHARRRGRGQGDDRAATVTATSTARASSTELAPAYELLRVQTNPIAIKAALNLSGTRSAATACRSSTRRTSAEVRDCLERARRPRAASARLPYTRRLRATAGSFRSAASARSART